jgi:DNA modification methylase
LVDVAGLKSAARIVRKHPAAKRRTVEADIRQHGIISPVIINAADVIVDGHLRVDIARKLGFRQVPAVRVEHLSDPELRAFAIAANKLPAIANYDLDALRLEFEEICADAPTIDLSLTGFTIGEVDRIVGNHSAALYDDLEDDASLDVPVVPCAQSGDLYALGDHRLICGNSLDADVLARLMDGELADCCFTDPPYNVKINGHVSGAGKHAEFAMASGEMSRPQFEEFLLRALANIEYEMRDGAIGFICMDHAHMGELILATEAVFDQRLNICIWDKGRGGMGSLYRSQHELVAVVKKGFEPHRNNVELGKHGRNRTNIWSFPGLKGNAKALKLHPTVKPVALIAEALLDVSAPNDVVLDPFGGSGSTLIAADRISRRARLVEFEPLYVDCTIARWEKLTGQKAILLERTHEAPSPIARAEQENA